jgi:hypothetical protein
VQPPPPPTEVKHIAELGVTIYLNGKRLKNEVAKTICQKLNSKTMNLENVLYGT